MTDGVALQPGDVALTPDTTVTASARDRRRSTSRSRTRATPRRPASRVTVEIDGSEAGTGRSTRSPPGEIATANVPLDPAPQSGDTADIHVSVEPVLGEQVADNNEADYTVTFE